MSESGDVAGGPDLYRQPLGAGQRFAREHLHALDLHFGLYGGVLDQLLEHRKCLRVGRDREQQPIVLSRRRRGRHRCRRRLPLVAVLVAGIASAASWPLAQQSRIAGIEREIAALKPRAEAALAERERQRRGNDRVAAILALRLARPPLIEVLDELSRAVPDNSWLTSLSIGGRDIVIEGLSPSAAGVVQALERGGGFAKIVFRSPINRDAASGLEQFRLGAVTTEGRR